MSIMTLEISLLLSTKELIIEFAPLIKSNNSSMPETIVFSMSIPYIELSAVSLDCSIITSNFANISANAF